jgi:3-hydroxy-9,10-secoandrosta-1,3,5(10)-triene-9,17-dione monooxygenase reductase component
MPSWDSNHFRSVLGHFATGITIVTAVDDGEPVGFTCQSFTSVSLDPPLVSFSPAKASSTWPRIERAGRFCANVLAHDQQELGAQFALSGADKFRSVSWRPGPSGSPVLDHVLAWVEADVHDVVDAGDHLIVLGQVLDLAIERDDQPLLFFRGRYSVLAAGALDSA